MSGFLGLSMWFGQYSGADWAAWLFVTGYCLWWLLRFRPTFSIQGYYLFQKEHKYQIVPGSKVGCYCCLLKLTDGETTRRLLIFADMLDPPGYRHLCLLVRCC
ncbi:MAG: hypothetical protein CENE_02476 [Candidatus Celerinatantimonas neptuna]|nr:MAG: hypothetical protein CENE_02476 [Candidatus Celerinatantimonas neptuna]